MNTLLFSTLTEIVIIIGAFGYLFKVMKQQVKSQQEQVNISKKFTELIDLKKIKEYVDINEESSRKRAELEFSNKLFEYQNDYVTPMMEDYQTQIMNLVEEKYELKISSLKKELEYKTKHKELHDTVSLVSALVPLNLREEMLKSIFPDNYNSLLEESNKIPTESLDSFKQKISTRTNGNFEA